MEKPIQQNFAAQNPPGERALDGGDLALCAYSACSMLSLYDYSVDASFFPFRSLKATAECDFNLRKITLRASDGFSAAPQDVLTGLSLSLFSRFARKKTENAYTRAYREFMKRKSTFELNNSIRQRRAITRKNGFAGENFNLKEMMLRVSSEYEIFFPDGVPSVSWSRTKSRRRLGFYDDALNEVVISRVFDSPKVPSYVVEYVVFHELLHAKHEARFERGKSMQCRVHYGEFKRDEKSFAKYAAAEEWLKTSLRYVR